MSAFRPNPSRQSLTARRGVPYLLCFFLVLIASSCTRDEASDEPVSWPELVRFDEIALRAEGFARTEDLASLDEARAELIKAGRAITPATIPSNAADPQQVETNLADLASLIEGLSSELDDESLTTLVLGLHPVIESLMSAAGMPHVHAHSHGDHDHGDHDHGHDHDDHNHGDHDHSDHDHGDGDEHQAP